jgi:hypothetical protein
VAGSRCPTAKPGIGCGCYPGVADAFAAALEDCTEEVRYVAAQAIGDAAGNQCERCNESCCKKDLVEKMVMRAYERDEEGCYIEASERVREALKKSLCVCCPHRAGEFSQMEMGGTGDDRPPGDTRPPGDNTPPPGDGDAPGPINPDPSGTSVPDRQAESMQVPGDPLTPVSTATSSRRTKTTSSRRTWQNKAAQVNAEEEFSETPIAGGRVSDADEAAVAPRQAPARTVATATTEAYETVRNVSPVAGPVRGHVVATNAARGMVEIHFQGEAKPARGDEILIYHSYLLGRELVGSLQVVGYDGDHVIGAFRGSRTFKVASGDEAVVDNPSVLSRR